MTLSIKKLQRKLTENGFFPDRYYQRNGVCVFIDCVVTENGQRFILVIPKEYKIYIEPDEDTFNIDIYDLPEISKDIKKEYENEVEPLDIAEQYESDIPTHVDEEDMTSVLEKEYKYEISIEDKNPENIRVLKDVYRQLSRLKYSVVNSKYSLGIMFKNYMFLDIKDDIVPFVIKNSQGSQFKSTNTRQLLITMNIEDFFISLETIKESMTRIRDGVEKILNRNYRKQITLLENMTNKCISSIKTFHSINNKKMKMIDVSNELKQHYDKCLLNEGSAINKMRRMIDETPDEEEDIRKIQRDLKTMENTKADILNHMMDTNERINTISLGIDKIMFDNLVLFNSIVYNFETLAKIENDIE